MKQEYKLVPHPQYGYLEIKPTPSNDEITKFYANEFYSGEYPKLNDSSLDVQEKDKEFYDAYRQDLCNKIEEIKQRTLQGLSILDIGCGWGQTLSYFKDRGMECFGFDPAPEAIEYGLGKGLQVKCAGMDDLNVFRRKFDVVLMQNVLEHLADPEHVIEVIYNQLLETGGLLIVDVPNEFSQFQLAGRDAHELNDWWVCPPNHLNYFSHTTLKNLVKAKGFNIKYLTSSFPLEMFLLFGDNYVSDSNLGRDCHVKRMNFERNLRQPGYENGLHQFYEAIAKIDLGRQCLLFAQK